VRPHLYDDASTSAFVVLGCMLSFAAVTLVSQHQSLLLRPLRPLVDQPSQTGLATRLAVAYPTAKGFRTGATLAMYSVVVLVIVLLIQISAILDAGIDGAVADATGGWALRVDYNPSTPISEPERALTTGQFAGRVSTVAPLLVATAEADDPLHRTTDSLPVVAVGVPSQLADTAPTLDKHLESLPDDAAAWRLVLADPAYVMVDSYYGSSAGPQGEPISPGSTITLTDPSTGRQLKRAVAGVVSDGTAFYGIGGAEFRYPVLMSQPAADMAFGQAARASSLLLGTPRGQSAERLATDLQGQFLPNGLVATDLRRTVEDGFAASRQFFRLMQGYLALGLLVGITSLGVIMVRAVRERRRTIGVLRAHLASGRGRCNGHSWRRARSLPSKVSRSAPCSAS